MNNLILHLLSNRPGPFVTPLFSQDQSFVPTIIPPAEQTLRSLLFLDKTETDYYLKIYLAILNAYPDWKQQFGSNLDESYAVEELMPGGVYIQGGDLLGYQDGPGLFVDPPSNSLPVELHYRISYLGDNLCQITGTESGIQYQVTLNAVGTDPNKIIRITWPSTVPLTGPLQLSQSWTLGSVVDIFVQPSNFPFTQLVSNLRGNAYLQSLLETYGITAEFNEDMDPVEQTAMALTVLGLTTQARVQAAQSSRETLVNSDEAGWLNEQASA